MAKQAVGERYVRSCYNKFVRKYWHNHDMPDFDTLDFEFEEWPDELGHVEWDSHGLPHLSLSPITRRKAGSLLKSVLAHEMCHLAIGQKYGHGQAFMDEVDRIHDLKIYREYF